MNEKWVDIKDYKGYYQVSNIGRVRSLDRYVNARNGLRLSKGKLLSKGKTNGNGYIICRLCLNNKQACKYFHRLVAETFIPNPNNYKVINHKNGNKMDNRVENLEWVSQKDNCAHAIVTGLTPIGENCFHSAVSDIDSLEIYKLAHEGIMSQKVIADLYDICQQTVSDIKLLKIRRRIILEEK